MQPSPGPAARVVSATDKARKPLGSGNLVAGVVAIIVTIVLVRVVANYSPIAWLFIVTNFGTFLIGDFVSFLNSWIPKAIRKRTRFFEGKVRYPLFPTYLSLISALILAALVGNWANDLTLRGILFSTLAAPWIVWGFTILSPVLLFGDHVAKLGYFNRGSITPELETRRMKARPILQTIVVSVIFFLILYVGSISNSAPIPSSIKLDPTLVFIALTPFIVWLIVSGKISELRGPGGLGISFQKATKADIAPLKAIPLPMEEARVLQKGTTAELEEKVRRTSPNVLSFEIGKKDYYEKDAITKYLEVLGRIPGFKLIVFTDATGRHIASTTLSIFTSLNLKSDYNLVEAVEKGTILGDPGIVHSFLGRDSTNKDALDEMQRAGVDTIPVLDKGRTVVGIVERNKIVTDVVSKVLVNIS